MDGERLKPILAARLQAAGVQALNRVTATNFLVVDGVVHGACGLGVRDGAFYTVEAPSVIVATGGATRIYPACNGDYARHRTWYPPFNTGAGYAMGIRAGAEMTSFEIRFVPLRVKDIFAPTGTVAQGVRAPQVNAFGVEYLRGKGRLCTSERLALTFEEERQGRGPCYLDLSALTPAEEAKLKESYLHMSPTILLYWADRGAQPHEELLEIAAGEPCVIGGHTQAGYWIDTRRETTIRGLFAAGDVAGGAPKKYVSGALIEGELAAEAALDLEPAPVDRAAVQDLAERELARAGRPLIRPGPLSPSALEGRLHKIMEEYAGGRIAGYQTCETRLKQAAKLLEETREMTAELGADSPHELMAAHEVIDRLDVARVMVAHLRHRKETRWPVYQERPDYPLRDDLRWGCFVNSRVFGDGAIGIVERPIGPVGRWDHDRKD
jgi:adenylylsulfate reductase subunit A